MVIYQDASSNVVAPMAKLWYGPLGPSEREDSAEAVHRGFTFSLSRDVLNNPSSCFQPEQG